MSTYSISPTTTTVNENGGSYKFIITRSGNTNQSATVDVSTFQDPLHANVDDYFYDGFVDTSIFFPAGQSSEPIFVNVIDEGLTLGSETAKVVVQQTPTSAVVATASFTILNNDKPTVPSSSIDALIPYKDITAGVPTAKDVVKAALEYQGAVWGGVNCTGLVWAVSYAIGAPFFNSDMRTSDGQHVIDADASSGPEYIVPDYGNCLPGVIGSFPTWHQPVAPLVQRPAPGIS